MAEEITGLSMEEVKRRREAGKGQGISRSITKPKWRIWKENIVTLFNFLNFMIAALLFLAGAYTNMLFLSIILLNIGIGIFQELKAKKLVDDLSILNRPKITAVREGRLVALTMEDLVEDDVLLLERGCQICNDAVVLSGRLEVNEALLTGESDPIGKKTGDTLLSGSSVISGRCYARVIHVGNENYATKLTAEVKREKQVESQLLTSMRKVTRFTSFLILPLGALLLFEAVFLRNDNFDTAIVSSAAALLGMLPKGLVLLISVSLANGVIRLSKQKILVQNLYSLETLAYVDTLCLDKTGTLTDGKIKVKEVIFAGDLCRGIVDRNQAEGWLRNYLAGTEDKNETMRALEECFPPEQSLTPTRRIPFSSERKWGAMGFADMGTIFVGAPERIDACPQQVARQLEMGYRVIAAGYSKEIWEEETSLPESILPLFWIVLEDTVRKNVKETLNYFQQEGIEIKIISGDHVKTVSMTAKKAGLARWKEAVDLSELSEEIDYEAICQRYGVFARATPKQKQKLIQALKSKGHRVAMTGDGVNDLLALREADCSISVAEGSDASRQISEIVLLQSDFTYLPQVLLEGRKVVNHVTRTAGVFFIKTLYLQCAKVS